MRKLNNFGFSHVLIPVLVFVMLGAIGGAYLLNKSDAATPAATTTSTTTNTTSTSTIQVGHAYHICMHLAALECVTSHGPGYPATVQQSNISTWTAKDGGANNTYQFQNAAGNCLKAIGSSNYVTVGGGACSQLPTELWVKSTNAAGSLLFKNVATNQYLGTNSTNTGSTVFTKALASGFDSGWAAR